MRLTRDAGRYVVVGQYTNAGAVPFNPHLDLNQKHLDVRGCWGSDVGHVYRAVQVRSRMLTSSSRGPHSSAGTTRWPRLSARSKT